MRTVTASRSLGTTAPAAGGDRSHRLSLPPRLFIISLVLPFFFTIGPMQMTANRLLLALWVVPGLIMWLQGRAGPVRVADLALFGMCLCVSASYLVLHGPVAAVEPSGIYFIETMGAYLMARCYIRNADDFYAIVRMLFWTIMLMLPFAIYETLTAHNILLELANQITYSGREQVKEARWGLDRVQGVLPHPIMFGVFCGGGVALTYYVLGYQAPPWKRRLQTLLVTGTAFLSLSSGPLTAIAAQLGLISWDRVLHKIKHRWAILSGGVLSLYVALEIAANRSAPEVFISYFAFNAETAYNRIRIWRFGTASVAEHPLFGVGLNDWARPEWMSSSIDMFWLVPAVVNGLPAALLLQLAFFSLFISTAFKSGLSDHSAHYRTGYLVCMMGFYLTGWTVHYWWIIYVLFIFLLGSGAWILDDDGRDETGPPNPPRDGSQRTGRASHYTRFAATHIRGNGT